ncbi:MAG: precorrin-3B C(17)-methyltransferase [Mesorhizobium sp.]|nr:precorrin-3B C(17)-methyltransferase [Mesorhizobium sp.]
MNEQTTTGRLTVVGLGPGSPRQLTPEAHAAIEASSDLFGYGPYLDRIALLPGQTAHRSDNREEIARASAALELAAGGRQVAVVSGGDAGVFAMAAAVCEAIEAGPETWRELEISIVPGVTAMLAVAASVGAPLGHDFCALSLSDNLKPWDMIERRLRAAASAGFVIALYNPVSRARPWQLDKAFSILREELPETVPVVFGRAAGRADEKMTLTDLAGAEGALADMATCVIVGSPETRTVARNGLPPLVYSPRSAGRPT